MSQFLRRTPSTFVAVFHPETSGQKEREATHVAVTSSSGQTGVNYRRGVHHHFGIIQYSEKAPTSLAPSTFLMHLLALGDVVLAKIFKKKTIVPIADSAYIPVYNSVFIINS